MCTLCGFTLPYLTLRRLYDNQFTGSVDALGTLTKLTYLYVRAGMDDAATLLIVFTFTK